MSATILKIDDAHPDSALMEGARQVSRGHVIIYPTDTLYGIGAAIDNETGIRKVFQIKERKADQPILILIENPNDLVQWVKNMTSEANRLISLYWPGPVTMVFEASEKVSPLLTGKGRTIGVRCPASPLVRRFLSLIQSPLTATSANLSNEPTVRDAREAEKVFGKKVGLILDAGPLISEPSTVVDVTGEKVKIIRQGKTRI